MAGERRGQCEVSGLARANSVFALGMGPGPLDLTLKAHRKLPKVSEQMREASLAPRKDWAR